MERLTKYLASGAADYNYTADCYGGNDCNDRVAKSAYRQTCVERLAAYEDTRMTPEEVSTLVKDWNDLCTIVGECGGITRVKALAEADKDGRLVVLPCKMGGELYSTLDDIGRLHQCRATYALLDERPYLNTVVLKPVDYEGSQYGASFGAFGKTVFLTREEAKKALEAMKDGN